jgi:hypothetical protein
VKASRRQFVATSIATVVATTLPLPLPVDSYWCDCGRVQYFRQPEGHYAASHIFIDGQWKRMDFGLFLRHNHIHRKMRSGCCRYF